MPVASEFLVSRPLITDSDETMDVGRFGIQRREGERERERESPAFRLYNLAIEGRKDEWDERGRGACVKSSKLPRRASTYLFLKGTPKVLDGHHGEEEGFTDLVMLRLPALGRWRMTPTYPKSISSIWAGRSVMPR